MSLDIKIDIGDNGFEAFARDKFESMPDLSPQPCIYKAPNYVRAEKKECYEPSVISIGPLYYGLPSLDTMQDNKWWCLKLFLDDERNLHRSDLGHYLAIVREMETRVRKCYVERITLVSDEFNGMILADSVFIICYFMSFLKMLSSPTMVGIRHMCKRNVLMWNAPLLTDLFLLENQVPFFILELLFQEAFGASLSRVSFVDIAFEVVVRSGVIPFVPIQNIISVETIGRYKIDRPQITHLVDFLRMFFTPPTPRQQQQDNTNYENVQCPSASNLKAAGVKFEASKGTHLLEITFSKGVLHIPPILVGDDCESLYRNLVLFEQSHQPIYESEYINDYLTFLDKLISSPEDVKILVECGIIENWMGIEDAVVTLFDDIGKNTSLPQKFYYFGLCRDLNTYANIHWNRWKAILKKDYFGHPWAAISVIFAFVLFVLTLAQTVGTFTNN